jgi:hypothetical protein
VGPAQPGAARKVEKEYQIEAFDIRIREGKALCPTGKTSTLRTDHLASFRVWRSRKQDTPALILGQPRS